jgi:hypothetical protein
VGKAAYGGSVGYRYTVILTEHLVGDTTLAGARVVHPFARAALSAATEAASRWIEGPGYPFVAGLTCR